MSTEPTYTEDDFESIATAKYKYEDHYIIVEIRQEEGTTAGDKRAFVTVHEPASQLIGPLGDLLRTKELTNWSWGVDDEDLDAELKDRLQQATSYIDDRRTTIDTMERNLHAAIEQSVPESEQKPDYRNPAEYREHLTTQIRKLVTSRLLLACAGLLIGTSLMKRRI
jgi:hypothetical protein